VLDNAELAEPGYRARYGIETREVPTYPSEPTDDLFVLEREELVVATSALPIEAWRDAYNFGYLLAALWNQRVLQTTLHVVQFAIGIEIATFVDALLGANTPRLAAIRDELKRYTAAILEARATTLVVEGWGPRRREPVDGVCARVLDDPAAFYAEAADVAAAIVGREHVALIRDAVAWDAVQIPAAESVVAEFAHDWIVYTAQMGERPRPVPRRTSVRWTSWPTLPDRGAQLNGFLGLGWAKQPRGNVARLP
jgi:hypothetical protein